MTKHRKVTPKRAKKPLKPSDVALILTALGGVLTGLAAILNALK